MTRCPRHRGRQGPRRRRNRPRRQRRPRRHVRRRGPATACRRCRSSARCVDGQYRIVSQPPIVVPVRELAPTYGLSPDEVEHGHPRAVPHLPGHPAGRSPSAAGAVPGGRRRPQGGRGRQCRHPGVHRVAAGPRSSRTRCSCRSRRPPPRCSEDHLPKSRYRQHGERVVHGQRMMQAASDIYLGWTKGVDVSRYFYWRQLRDMKGSAEVEAMAPFGLNFYAGVCGWTLARAHARSGDPIAIAAYLGDNDTFDRSITDFCRALRRPERAGLPGVRGGDPIRTAGGTRRRLSAAPSRVSPTSQPWPTSTQTTKTSSLTGCSRNAPAAAPRSAWPRVSAGPWCADLPLVAGHGRPPSPA